jgi:fatty-acyl-CoA synthase
VLARFKVPKYIRFCEAFPMTASGKVRKDELRRMAAEELVVSAAQTSA